MDRENVVYSYYEIVLEIKKNEVLVHAVTWMNFENIMLSKSSRVKKEREAMGPHRSPNRSG